MDIKTIEKTYEKMTDNELVRIATTSAEGLRPEVFSIIENEIKKRNLDPDLFKAVLAQNKEYTADEIAVYAELLRELPCPVCANTTEKLNGTITHTVKSFIVFTSYETKPAIACPNCLDKMNNQAMVSTALLGWWGIPWGLFKTPVYLYRNHKAKQYNRLARPNDTLVGFTLANIGEIEAYRNNKERLKLIIAY
jgi:hypothetical protein